MSNHEQPTTSHPRSDVRNTIGKDKPNPSAPARTYIRCGSIERVSAKHYEKLLPIMADKYEYEKRKKEKLEEVKARLDFGDALKKSTRAQELAYSESRTISPRRQRRSRSLRHNPSVFARLRRERSRLPRHEYKNKERRESNRGSRTRYNYLREEFLKNYLQQKKCIRDPIVLYNIKQRDEESTKDFIQRYKSESGNVKGAPECMRISEFVHGITNPELIKRFHEKIPKIVDEMMQVATSFLQGQEAASNQERKKVPQAWRHPEGNHRQNFKKGGGFRSQHKAEKKPDRFTLLTKTPKEILALEKGKFKTPPPMTTSVEKRNANKFCEFHGEVGHNTDECNHLRKQIEDMLKAGKLSHIIRELKQNSGKEQPKKKGETSGKEKPQAILMIQARQNAVRQKITQSFSPDLEISFPPLGNDEGAEGPLIIEAEVGGHQDQTGEIKWPLGQITLLVKVGDDEHSTSAWMDFMVVRSTSPFNGIIGRPGVRKMKAVPSTTHGMIKFPVMGGILTLRSSKIIPIECAMVSGPEEQPPPMNKVKEERIKVAIKSRNTRTYINDVSDLTEKPEVNIDNLLQSHLWTYSLTPTDMTGVPRQIAEHKLNVRKGCPPVMQKKRGQAAERNIEINDKVSKLVTAGIMREVYYHDWLFNPVMVSGQNIPRTDRSEPRGSESCIQANEGTYSKVTYAHRSRRTRGTHCLPSSVRGSGERHTHDGKGGPADANLLCKPGAKGPEINYTAMEKCTIKPEAAGRMQKWSIQLGEFGIHYMPRVSVKGQVLANFIVERPEEEGKDDSAREEEPLRNNLPLAISNLEEFCEKHYEKLLPIMADKYEYEQRKKEKLEEVKARLDFGDARKKSTRVQESALRRERSRSSRHEYKSKARRESTVFKRLKSRGRSTSAHFDSRQESSRYTENHSESEDSEGGRWKSKIRRKKSSVEDDDLSQPWVCAETDPFTSRRHFDFPKTRMPSYVKPYNGSEDPEDHLKILQAAAKIKRWAMPTWCHMFNSTLIGNAPVWFDDLPPESIDSYNDLREAFLKNYLQQKKCIRDPIVLHNIKQRDGESTEDFIQRYKSESGNVKGAPKCMRISGFVRGITNPELIKRFHEKFPKTVGEMMQVATSFLQGQKAASNQERKKFPPAWRHQEGGHRQSFNKGGGFRSQHKQEKRPDRFTLLTKTPKEILALEKGKSKTPPPMTTPVEKRNKNKFCEFHEKWGIIQMNATI
ncbi:reverse transcriptase domain-containing protein [Tanacetum coccineum]